MKKIFALSLLLILLFFGCDQDSGLTSPVNESADQQLKVKSVHSSSEDEKGRSQYLHREDRYPPGADSIFVSLKLPASEIPDLVVSKAIDGDDGGEMLFNYEYQTRKGNTISILAKMYIPIGAFKGVKDISMVFNNENATISFYPHIVFNKPAEFKTIFTGIDLSGLNPKSVDFIFQNYDGTIEHVKHNPVSINDSTGTIAVQGVVLTHFSRYGFVN